MGHPSAEGRPAEPCLASIIGWRRTSFHLQSRPFSQYLGVKNSLRPGWPGLFLIWKIRGQEQHSTQRGELTTIGKNTHRLGGKKGSWD